MIDLLNEFGKSDQMQGSKNFNSSIIQEHECLILFFLPTALKLLWNHILA